jgi:hypothetical protein
MEKKSKINIDYYKMINNIDNIKTIEQLRKLFNIGELKDIIIYELSYCSIKPNKICIFNGLKNHDF